MHQVVPEEIQKIYQTFHNAGFKLYLVGGSVRNMLFFKENALANIKDWDMTTNATPQEMLKLFPNAFYDNSFGTVGIPVEALKDIEHAGVVEVTTFRTERNYIDHRHPEVSWGKTIEEDLSRRDFTMNAIAMELTDHISPIDEANFIDPFNGKRDIANKIIRSVGNSNERFKEDALRLMRAIRFAAQLGFQIENQTLQAITNDALLLSEIAGERIRDELLKLLASDYPYEGIMLLKNTGLLHQIIPELLEGVGVSQERPGRHHKDDVFTHNILSLKFCPSTNPIVRFATLIHDVGKPRVAASDEDGYVIFHNHEIIGSRMAYNICDRLRFSKKQREKIVKLIRWHMFTVDEHITDSAVRRFIRRIGVENVKDMMDLRVGDRLGGGTQTAESWRLKLFKQRVEKQLAPAPFSINDLAIDGNDIMKELKIKPGRKIGAILQKLFEEIDEDLSKNTKEYLLQRIKTL
ncbi:MAG TPA: CCA tRNA nucleotidyltransferase [Candidatus Sulfotelmatobacter sp.]|jgi:tRNA nucleotidyltransferase (CCA-adding enzyme)|nr:CCA tRNA nucleotidyltransferase [Candidatus Sulfotelmatobacter sp.]